MKENGQTSFFSRIGRMIVGGARSVHDPQIYHSISLVAFFAWVGLGADGLSSSCYGPSEAFFTLMDYPRLAIFVALGSVITIAVISSCYSKIIELFPAGGGGYLVASRLLSPSVGMVAGCALMIDYSLTISLSIASGTEAVFSFLPLEYHRYMLLFSLTGVVMLSIMNMRGVKESVGPLIPIFLLFIVTHLVAILYAFGMHFFEFGTVMQETANEVRTATAKLGVFGMLALIMRAYSMGAGTYTGIEAVSNGMPMLREPRVQTGKRTMLYMATSLIVAVLGLMIAYVLCDVTFVQGKTINAVFLEKVSANWNPKVSYAFVLTTLISEAAILFVAAQTGFLGGPRVLANMSLDRWFPTRFAMLSDRLVTRNGVILMGGSAFITMALTRGSVQFLVVLYSITVFITFVLSQIGMVRYWWSVRRENKEALGGLAINGFGLVMTTFILISVTIVKFKAGGWVTLLAMGILIVVALMVKRHYNNTFKMLKRLDTLVDAAKSTMDLPSSGAEKAAAEYDKHGKTAIILVNGFNGLGLHTLFSVIRLFGSTFKNYVFVQVGIVDAGNFKGVEEVEHLNTHIKDELEHYAEFMQKQGYYAETFAAVGIDIVDEVCTLLPKIDERFPNTVFFGGQIVFPEDTILTRLLHNYIVFALQRRLYSRGIPFVILPIRVAA